MIVPPNDPVARAWFDAGVKAAPELDGHYGAVLVGSDPQAIAYVALGVASAVTTVRRVALADLIGDSEPLVALQGPDDDDAHGIVDSFLYGVSLNKIAREAPGVPNLFVLPSGSETVQREDVLTSDRWRRLAAGFKEVQALLLLCTTADAPGVDTLVEHVGGAVLVGAGVVLGPNTNTITTVMPDLRAARRASAAAAAPAIPDRPRRPTTEFKAVLEDAMEAPEPANRGFAYEEPAEYQPPERERGRKDEAPKKGGGRGALIGTGLAVATFALGLAGAIWWRQQQAPVAPPPAPVIDTATAVKPPRDTTPVDSGPPEAPQGPVAPAIPVVANPADSIGSSAWSVEILATNTEEEAKKRLADAGKKLPAGTWAPSTVGLEQAVWFKVMGGATVDRIQAEALLATLRRGRVVAKDAGRVVQAPFGFLLASSVQTDSVPTILADYLARGLPAYALRRADGRADLLSGAFESPQQAALFLPALEAAKVEPVLVYRTGRVF